MKLNQLTCPDGSHKRSKRLGRGPGSGKGKTSGKGVKGQHARSGVSINGFEGGQMPLHMRLPKRGFNNIFARDYAQVNLNRIEAAIADGRLKADGVINAAALRAAGLVRGGKDGVRLLAKGGVKTKLNLEVTGASAGAIEAVNAAGGSVRVLGPKVKPKNKGRPDKPGKRQLRREKSVERRAAMRVPT